MELLHLPARIVEAYIGEYASGKSEVAINRALELVDEGRKVTLVDLDTVEPFYTLRPIKGLLTERGLEVIAWDTKDLKGLGETGVVLHPDIPWVLRREGDVILDVGYGVGGAKTLNLVEGAMDSKELRVIAVINISRPMTGSLRDVVEYIQELGLVHSILNNSHLGDLTDLEIIEQGARVVTEAARILDLPVEATVVEEKWRGTVGSHDVMGNPIRFIRRYMKDSFW